MVAYGVETRTERLLWNYWERLKMVAWVGIYCNALFTGSNGVTQGNPLYLTIFNMVVDTVIQHWATRVAREDTGPEGFGRVVPKLTTLL